MSEPLRKIVLGLGNNLNSDEGLGVHCLKALQKRLGERADVELLDGGVLGMNLLPIVESASHLLILDAIDARKPPGTIIEVGREDIPLFSQIKMSQHQVTFQEVLGFASIRGKLPRYLYLIGAQPGDLSVGAELSPAIVAVIPLIIARAEAVLKEWGISQVSGYC